MAKKKLTFSANNIVNAIVYGVIGLLLIILKGGSLGILMTVVGALLCVMGVMDIAKGKDAIKGIVELICGVAIIVLGWLVADIVLLVFGIVLIVRSAMELIKNYKNGFAANLSSIVSLVIGILLVVAKWALMDVLCIVAGVIFLVDAVLMFVGKK